MSMEKLKKFVKEHKTGLIVGTVTIVNVAAMVVVGVKCRKPKLNDFAISKDPYFTDLLEAVDHLSVQNEAFIAPGYKAVYDMFDKDGKLAKCIKCEDGSLLRVHDFIVFGDVVDQ